MGKNLYVTPFRLAMVAEFFRVATPTPESMVYLKKCDLTDKMVEIESLCTDVTVALVNFFDGIAGRIFRFHKDGQPAVVIGAHPAVGEMPYDLVAWPLYGNDRDAFATYRQEADLLGVPAALRHRNSGVPLWLQRTPEDWLLSGFAGTCVLNAKWGGHWLAKLPGPFICADIEHGRQIAAMLKPYGKAHLVLVPAPARLQEAA